METTKLVLLWTEGTFFLSSQICFPNYLLQEEGKNNSSQFYAPWGWESGKLCLIKSSNYIMTFLGEVQELEDQGNEMSWEKSITRWNGLSQVEFYRFI